MYRSRPSGRSSSHSARPSGPGSPNSLVLNGRPIKRLSPSSLRATVPAVARQSTREQREEQLYGRPTSVELLEAACEFLRTEVMAATEGHVQFHTRVTIRVLETVKRQLELGSEHVARQAQTLASLGFDDSWELVDAIRGGAFDERIPELAAALEPEVRAKLEVADPRYIDS